MKAAELPQNEPGRLEALRRYDVLDTDFEEAFDQLTHLASCICEAPISLVSLVDENRQWFKSSVGLEARETPRELAFCAHAIHNDALFVVPDASSDLRFADNPLVLQDPKIRFYAGAPLKTEDGFRLGTLCVIDRKPRELSTFQQEALGTLSRQVMDQLELRRSLRELEKRNKEIAELVVAKDKLFAMISHDLRNPIAGIVGLSDLMVGQLEEDDFEGVRESMPFLGDTCQSTLGLLNNLLDFSRFETGNLKFDPIPLNLVDLIRDELDNITISARNKGVELGSDFPAETMASVDRSMIASALRNLLSNAVKFTPSGKSVSINVHGKGDYWQVVIQDQGIGMSDAATSDEDTPQQRRGTSGEAGSGLGLGLVRRFLGHHNAVLKMNSAPGQGTEASFLLRKYTD